MNTITVAGAPGKTGPIKSFANWLAPLGCALTLLLLLLLAACGGGGGSPGSTGNGTPPPVQVPSKVASVSLVASALTIDSAGIDGTEVTLTAIVKDASNNALAGETVAFTSDSGIISNTNRTSSANGTVVEKISVKDNSAPRVITVTANVGTVKSDPVKITVVVAMPTLTLTADAGVLASSGAPGTELNLLTLVKDGNNNVVPGVTVDLSVDSGNLTYANHVSDAKGTVTAKLDTIGNPTSRVILVTAKAPGAKTVTMNVNVAGNKLVINNSGTIKVGVATDVTVKLVDSAGNGLAGRPVAYSSGTNPLSVKNGASAVTDSSGQLVLSYTANTAGSDTIVVKAAGETASSSITVSATNFTVNAVSGATSVSTAFINTCVPVQIHDDVGGVAQSGTVALSSSRGNAYSEASCSTVLTVPLVLANGNASAYVKAVSPGVSTLTATTNGLSTQSTLEFVAPYTSAATVIVQADPAVVGVNPPGSKAQQSTLKAIVLDGTPANNLVKNAQVSFNLDDPSGGVLSQPSVVLTGSDGTASVSYIAGASDTKLNGVTVTAQLQGASSNSATVQLTVAKKAASITAGTGSTILVDDPAVYQVDYAVFVTDAAGNPVPGVNLTSSVRPRNYYKGQLYFSGTQGPWAIDTVLHPPLRCQNEDVNSDNILQSGEDVNGDKILTPGNAVTVTPTATTDARGQAKVSLRYARDRANWLDVDLTIRGQVSGTEARYVTYTLLPGASADYASVTTSPPGVVSPYGKDVNSCSNTN